MGAFLLHWLTKILVVLFFAGMFGSTIIIIITFFEDGKILMGRDEKKLPSASPEGVMTGPPPKTARNQI